MENSFYDLNYIINLGEKRVDLYLTAYQNILGRITNIILVYSAIAIYLIPIAQDLIDGARPWYVFVAIVFLLMMFVSVCFTIRLLIPVDVAYLEVSNRYTVDLLGQYEAKLLKSDLSSDEIASSKSLINKLLKASYIDELSRAQAFNQTVAVTKSSFYYRALIWGLAAVIPYVVCIGFHLSRKDEKVQKVHLVYEKKCVNCTNEDIIYG